MRGIEGLCADDRPCGHKPAPEGLTVHSAAQVRVLLADFDHSKNCEGLHRPASVQEEAADDQTGFLGDQALVLALLARTHDAERRLQQVRALLDRPNQVHSKAREAVVSKEEAPLKVRAQGSVPVPDAEGVAFWV